MCTGVTDDFFIIPHCNLFHIDLSGWKSIANSSFQWPQNNAIIAAILGMQDSTRRRAHRPFLLCSTQRTLWSSQRTSSSFPLYPKNLCLTLTSIMDSINPVGGNLRLDGLLELRSVDIGKSRQEQIKAQWATEELYKCLMLTKNRVFKGSPIMKNWHETDSWA